MFFNHSLDAQKRSNLVFFQKPQEFISVGVIELSTDWFGAWMGRECLSMPIVLFTVQGKIQENGCFPLHKKQNLVILMHLRSVVKVLRHSKLTTGWCETWGFSKVCKQLYTEKLDQQSPRKCLFGQKFLSQGLKPKRLFCVVQYTVGEACFGLEPGEPRGARFASFLSKEPSRLLPQPHSI